MINNISEYSSISNTPAQTTQKPVVDEDFLGMLTERFNTDNIPDACSTADGESLSNLLDSSSLLGVEVVGNSIGLDDIQGSIKRDFAAFGQMLDFALEEAGISRNPGFDINYSGSGRLYIDADHPNKEEIETILNGAENIRNTYARMSANSSLLAAAERHIKFSRAYEIDPQSAVQQYSYLFDSEPCDAFSIFVSEEGYKPKLISYGEDAGWEGLINSQSY